MFAVLIQFGWKHLTKDGENVSINGALFEALYGTDVEVLVERLKEDHLWLS